MIKALFVIGQCIRLLSTDPWQSPTFKVIEVGKYSYRVVRVDFYATATNFLAQENVVPFDGLIGEKQSSFEVVDCPDKHHER